MRIEGSGFRVEGVNPPPRNALAHITHSMAHIRQSMAHIRQSKPDSGLGLRVRFLNPV